MVNWAKYKKMIPISIQLARHVKYEVLWTKDFKDGATLGETRFDPNQIAIQLDQSNKETVHTYIHEVLHAISQTYDVGLTETQVIKLEKALYYIMKPGNLFR